MTPRAWLRAALAAALLTEACAGPPPRGLVLVSIDTLRPDRLGCYGAAAPTSPEIDTFRRRSVLFREVRAAAPSTLLSHAALFAARPPQRHGASHLRSIPLPKQNRTLAEALRARGFRTAAIHGGGQLAAEFGLDRGFESYTTEEGPFRAAVVRGLDWLAGVPAGEPYFLFLHTYEVHHPYDPDPALLAAVERPPYRGSLPSGISVRLLEKINAGRKRIDAEDLRHVEAAYDAEIRSMDAGFGDLVRGLDRLGRLPGAVVALVSDHGEEFGEHGRVGWHSHTLYEELLRVPLLLRLPGDRLGGSEVRDPFRLIDLAPTLLALFGVDPPSSFDGVDRGGLLRGERPARPAPLVAFGEVDGRRFEGLLLDHWKLAEDRLFDLATDPGERRDLALEQPQRARELARLLRELTPADAPGDPITLGDETRRRLRALGYL